MNSEDLNNPPTAVGGILCKAAATNPGLFTRRLACVDSRRCADQVARLCRQLLVGLNLVNEGGVT